MKERIILFAEEGKVITDGKNFGKTVILAEGISADKYTEITDEEYKAEMAKRDEVKM